MKITQTEIAEVYDIELTPHEDERGFFARVFCPQELAAAGIIFTSTQINLSRNHAMHTLRGMHYQEPPFSEAKLVRAVSGSLFDVAVDLRSDSPTRYRWIARTLCSLRGNALLLPAGVAHGFLTMEPGTDVLYQMSQSYVPGHARGFRFDDPKIGIEWPHPPSVISGNDLALAFLDA